MSKNRITSMKLFIWGETGNPSCTIDFIREGATTRHYDKTSVSPFLSKAVHKMSRNPDLTVHVIPHTHSTSLFIYNSPHRIMHPIL